MFKRQVLSYVFPFAPQTSPSAGGQNGRQATLCGEAVGIGTGVSFWTQAPDDAIERVAFLHLAIPNAQELP
jgi:hypothetical protein